MSLLPLDNEIRWSGSEIALIFGQEGHRVITQTSHLLRQSVSSRVGPDQVGSPRLTLKGKLKIAILGEEIEKLLKDRCWNSTVVLQGNRNTGHNFKDAQGRITV